MKILAIIPARGGSKRIPRKNMKKFMDKPIIAYSIESALQAKVFDEVMVSTNDQEIVKIALEYGVKVPFIRTEQTANDFATLADVVEEVVLNYEELGQKFDYICCILPTAPFLTSQRLVESLSLLVEGKYDSVTPVLRFSYPIQRALQIDSSNKLSMIWSENLKKRSQDLLPTYHDCGQFYWMRTNAFLREKSFFMKNGGAIVLLEKEVQDIDTLEDWELAELKYKILLQHD